MALFKAHSVRLESAERNVPVATTKAAARIPDFDGTAGGSVKIGNRPSAKGPGKGCLGITP
jgi:hypothetical protein